MNSIKKVASKEHTWLMSDYELQVMSLTSVKKIFYNREISHRQNILKPYLTTFGFKIYHPEKDVPSKPEKLKFKERSISIGEIVHLKIDKKSWKEPKGYGSIHPN